MPPHCDTLDDPVVLGARRALEDDDVDLGLPFPVIPLAQQAVETGDAGPLVEFLQRSVAEEAGRRLAHLRVLAAEAATGVPAARDYTSAMLGFLVWSHKLWRATTQEHDR